MSSPSAGAPHLHLDTAACLDLEASLEKEWLETDGLGGYAASTVHLCPTRRYHGLLVGRPADDFPRHVFLSRFDEVLRTKEGEHPFSTARYADCFAPRGYEALSSFELAPWPTAVYRLGETEIVREVLVVRGSPTVLCRYRMNGPEKEAVLELRPLLPFRNADELTTESDAIDTGTEEVPGGVSFRPYPYLPALSITFGRSAFEVEVDPVWYRDVRFSADERRGYGGREDELSPALLRLTLKRKKDVVVAATTGAPVANPRSLWKREAERRAAALAEARETKCGPAELRCRLVADDFLYRRPTGTPGVLAGFPWFIEWGRDTFIALPGLTLARGRVDECAEVLSGALEYLQDGLLPNIYGLGRSDSDYGSADASLWFARAVRLYEKAGGDEDRVRDEYLPALEEIATAYFEGTALGIAADESCLVSAGGPDLNPTWMDACTAGGPVTPRDGCPVEIAALWYSLMQQLERLLEEADRKAEKKVWAARRRTAKKAFLERFWLEDEGYLADRWKDGDVDSAVRPNMVIAASLELSPLNKDKRAGVVERARAELLTPRGLRTLSPRDAAYRGVYAGGPDARDGAYHQGTAWPWLLGFHVEAALRGLGTKKAQRTELGELLDGVEAELDRAGLDHVSEVFDGDEPQTPGGSFAQAWNTAELLRARAMLRRGRP